MTKFKVGDAVRVNAHFNTELNGHAGTVERFELAVDEVLYYVTAGERSGWFRAPDLERADVRRACLVRITPAQMAALETAGVFDADESDEPELVTVRAAINGACIVASDAVAAALHELSNSADELGHEKGREDAAMYRSDSRVLCNLAVKVGRAARAPAAAA